MVWFVVTSVKTTLLILGTLLVYPELPVKVMLTVSPALTVKSFLLALQFVQETCTL